MFPLFSRSFFFFKKTRTTSCSIVWLTVTFLLLLSRVLCCYLVMIFITHDLVYSLFRCDYSYFCIHLACSWWMSTFIIDIYHRYYYKIQEINHRAKCSLVWGLSGKAYQADSDSNLVCSLRSHWNLFCKQICDIDYVNSFVQNVRFTVSVMPSIGARIEMTRCWIWI